MMQELKKAYVPGELLREYRRKTGPLRNIEQNTEGISIREIPDISEMPTMMLPAVPKSPPLTTEKLVACVLVPSGMYVDEEGRMCLKIRDVAAHTIDLADDAVDRFHSLTGFYPDEIVACPSRYALLRHELYFPQSMKPIQFVRDWVFPVDYDIIARGRLVI